MLFITVFIDVSVRERCRYIIMVIRNNTSKDVYLLCFDQKHVIKSNSCFFIDNMYLPRRIAIRPIKDSSIHLFFLGALIEGFFDTSFIIPRQVCGLELTFDDNFINNPSDIDIYDNKFVMAGKENRFCPIELIGLTAVVDGTLSLDSNYYMIGNQRLKKRFILTQLLLSGGIFLLIGLLLFGKNSRLSFLLPVAIALVLGLFLIPAIISIRKFTKFCTTENCNKVLKQNYKSEE